MCRWGGGVVFGLALAAIAGDASAHEVNLGAVGPERPNLVHLRAGAERGFVSGVGYSRVFEVAARPLVATADATIPIARPGGGDYRLRTTAQMPALGTKRWMLAPRVAMTVRGVRTDLNRMTSVGGLVGVGGGHFARRWFIAAELALEAALATHIHHTAQYRATVFADARSGWYRTTAAHGHYGLYGGYSGRRVSVVGRVGQTRNLVDGGAGLLPLYATVAVSVAF